MTFEVWAGAALLLALAVLYGRALDALGAPTGPAGPAVGFAVELIAAEIGSELPGLAHTGAVILLALALLSVAVCVLKRDRPGLDATPWIVIVVAVVGTALPFLSNGRMGLLGVSLDDDTAAHLTYAAALASSSVAHHLPAPTGYPLAPHAIAAALADGAGIPLAAAFNAFTIASVIITALVGSAALGREEPWWKRTIAGTVVAFMYLEAAYYGEDSFKELILGMLLLGFVVCLESVRADWAQHDGRRWPLLISLAVLLAGALYNYGYLAVVWFAVIVFLWGVAELATAPRSVSWWRARGAELAAPVAVGVVAVLVLLAPIVNRFVNLFSTFGVSPNKAITVTNTGDLSGKISPYEALGIWQSFDFRSLPHNVFHAGELGAFALAVLILAVVVALVRRRWVLAAGVIGCAVVYAISAHSQSSYVTAKSLTIASPLVGLVVMRALLGSSGSRLSRAAVWVRGLVAALYVVLAMWSTSLVLRAEPVWPMTGPDELMSFARLTRGSDVLFLGSSEYATWLFDRSTLAGGPRLGEASPTKADTPGTALDWDNLSSSGLDHYRWVVTTNSPNASQAPAAFHLIRRSRLYELWRREGPVARRQSIDAPNNPGAVLDCASPADRRISREPGVAALMTAPVAVGVGVIAPGAQRTVSLSLPAGRWELSMQYVSGMSLRVAEPGGPSFAVPAYLDEIGPFFGFAQIRSYGGLTRLVVQARRPSFLTPDAAFLEAQVEAIVATRVPDARTIVPLRRACGRYIDWYKLRRS